MKTPDTEGEDGGDEENVEEAPKKINITIFWAEIEH